MELFSEIYNCYYQVLRHLLCSKTALTIQQIRAQICGEGFEESLLSMIPKLETGAWNLFEREGGLFVSKLSASSFFTPVSNLEKSYLKALLSDPRMRLFLNQEQLENLDAMLLDVAPLWKQGQFYYFDRFTDGDPYEDERYRRNFRTLLAAQKNHEYVDIDYNSPRGNRVHHHYIPARLEYSVKNDKFRLLALQNAKNHRKLEILNLSRMQSVHPTGKTFASGMDFNALIQNSYYQKPLKLHIINKRNALERAMLHFANYEKNTTKLDEETYECLIYYNQVMETELLIEVMSFGPMLTVVGNEKFLKSLKARLQRQKELTTP